MTARETQLTTTAPIADAGAEGGLNVPRVLRLSTFQFGSAMGDILVTSVWNRIMIANFGIPAWPVGLLIAMRYLLSPLSLWAGHRSDTHPLAGLHRIPYIWAGRSMMVASFPLLGLSLGRLGQDTGDVLGWAFAVACFLLYGTGTLISGSPYLALVRDSVPKARQGLAISIVETVLISTFPVAAIGFGYWLETYSMAVFWQVIAFAALVGGFFWWFAITGAEKRELLPGRDIGPSGQVKFAATFRSIWGDGRARHFFIFLALGTVAAWLQDNVLEPFGAEVFDLGVGQTTRFNAYWQGTTVLFLVLAAAVYQRSRPGQQTLIAKVGLSIMAAGMILLAYSALEEHFRFLQLALIVFGSGFGLYSFGAFNLLAVMTTDRAAGAYLGLWSVCILVSRGLGIGLGSVLRDVFIAVTGRAELAYGSIFVVSAVGLAAASLMLSRKAVLSFAADNGRLTNDDLPVNTTEL
jgi:MFS transporter, BCD family, chlorophyll transporter